MYNVYPIYIPDVSNIWGIWILAFFPVDQISCYNLHVLPYCPMLPGYFSALVASYDVINAQLPSTLP